MTLWLAVAVLATWRISSLLVLEDGPLDVFMRLRWWVGTSPIRPDADPRRSGHRIPIISGVLGCLDCTSVWVGLAATATWWPDTWQGWVLIPLALSTGAIVIERVVRS